MTAENAVLIIAIGKYLGEFWSHKGHFSVHPSDLFLLWLRKTIRVQVL